MPCLGGKMKIIATLTQPQAISAYLDEGKELGKCRVDHIGQLADRPDSIEKRVVLRTFNGSGISGVHFRTCVDCFDS